MSNSKQTKRSSNSDNAADDNVCEGNRIVNIAVLAKNLKCHACNRTLSLEKIVKEKRIGLHSIFTIYCEVCCKLTQVDTGNYHEVNKSLTGCKHSTHANINTKAVLATIKAGIFCKDLNKILAFMNTPGIPESLYKEYEKEVGAAIIEIAEESENDRVAKEREQS